MNINAINQINDVITFFFISVQWSVYIYNAEIQIFGKNYL